MIPRRYHGKKKEENAGTFHFFKTFTLLKTLPRISLSPHPPPWYCVQESWKEERKIWSGIPFFKTSPKSRGKNIIVGTWVNSKLRKSCESLHFFWNLLVMLFGDGSGVPGYSVELCPPPPKHSVECCEPPDIVLSIVNLWKSDPFWVGAFQLTWFKIEVQVTEKVQRLLEECCI